MKELIVVKELISCDVSPVAMFVSTINGLHPLVNLEKVENGLVG